MAEQSTCRMSQQGPYDFAWCDTHDTTFPLGSVCKFHGKDPLDVLQDEADEQRGLKVRAEQELRHAHQAIAVYLATWGGGIPPIWKRIFGDIVGPDRPSIEEAHVWITHHEKEAE